jgi:hypothetical protein
VAPRKSPQNHNCAVALWTRIALALSRSRERRRLHREADRLLDELFSSRPAALAQGRLAPRHRRRISVLEVSVDADGAVDALLLGIVRHPRAHPLATRGEEVVELLLYRPRAGSLENVGSRNLSRTRGPAS